VRLNFYHVFLGLLLLRAGPVRSVRWFRVGLEGLLAGVQRTHAF